MINKPRFINREIDSRYADNCNEIMKINQPNFDTFMHQKAVGNTRHSSNHSIIVHRQEKLINLINLKKKNGKKTGKKNRQIKPFCGRYVELHPSRTERKFLISIHACNTLEYNVVISSDYTTRPYLMKMLRYCLIIGSQQR